MLTLALLGSPEVVIDDAPLQVDTRKAVALLAFLAVERGEHPRDRLVELLWPDGDPDKSRSSLRRTLSTLRTALGDRWVAADRAAVSIHGPDLSIDLDEFAAAIDDLHGHDATTSCPRCLPALRRAASLYRGEFMAGFVLRDAPEFEAWVRVRSEQVARRADRLFTRLAGAQASAGDYVAAIETTARRITIDSLNEDAYRRLMLLHAWSGDRSGAVDAYRNLVAILDTELGVSPLEETTGLYEAILEEDLPRAPAPVRRPIATPEASNAISLPLIGRDPELAAVLAAVTPPGGMASVSGPMGIGVSVFLHEIATRLRNDGATVLAGSGAASGAGIPFGVIHDALLETLADPDGIRAVATLPSAVLAEASRVFPGLSPAPPRAESGNRTRFLDAMARVIAALPRPVLIVDDSHRCDEASAEMIAFLAARSRRFGISLVVGSALGDAPEEGPVAAMLDDVARRGTTVTLAPLTPDEVATLIAAGGVTLEAGELTRRTGGLPLFVTEAIRAAAGGRTEAVPDQVRRLFSERIATLDGAATQVLDAVVVVGRHANPSLLAAISGRSLDETDGALDTLTRRGMVGESEDGTVTIVHEYLAAVVAGRHTAARRRLLHRRAASALEAQPRQRSDAIRIARHRLTAGDDRLASTWFRAAGDEAAAVFAHGEAIEHYESALASEHPERAALHGSAARSALLAGRYDRAIAGYQAALAEGGPDPVVEHRLGEIHRRLQRWDLAAAHYDRAADQATDPELRAIVAADRAFVEGRRRGPAAARPLVAEALLLAADSASARASTRAENVAGLMATGDERLSHLRLALTYATEPAERMAVLNNLAAAVDDPEEAVRLAREALELAIEGGDRHLMAVLHTTLADALHRAGKSEASMASLTEAVSLFTEITTGTGEAWSPEVWLLTEW